MNRHGRNPYKCDEDRIIDNIMVDSESGCWEWMMCKRNGYGTVSRPAGRMSTHRLSYSTFVGEIPEGECVCHLCDNPGCCNPEHLFLGSQLDNIQDRCRKDRSTKGGDHPCAKISEDDAADICREYATGMFTQTELGDKYGIDRSQISRIIKGSRWSHIDRIGPEAE